MEYDLKIWCEDCTEQARASGDNYFVWTFADITTAVNHIIQYGHIVKAELEARSEEE